MARELDALRLRVARGRVPSADPAAWECLKGHSHLDANEAWRSGRIGISSFDILGLLQAAVDAAADMGLELSAKLSEGVHALARTIEEAEAWLAEQTLRLLLQLAKEVLCPEDFEAVLETLDRALAVLGAMDWQGQLLELLLAELGELGVDAGTIQMISDAITVVVAACALVAIVAAFGRLLRKSKKKDKDTKTNEVTGAIVTAVLKKARLTIENKKVETLLDYSSGLDPYYGLLDLAAKFDLVKKVSNKYEFEDGTKAFESAILNSPEKYFTKDLLKKIDERCKDEFLYGKTNVTTIEENES